MLTEFQNDRITDMLKTVYPPKTPFCGGYKDWARMETPFSHYKSMGNFLDLKGNWLRSQWSDLAEIQTCLRLYACPRYLQV